jgi:hypothetical protein
MINTAHSGACKCLLVSAWSLQEWATPQLELQFVDGGSRRKFDSEVIMRMKRTGHEIKQEK